MPICKNCKKYVLAFPCSYCGGTIPLTDRKVGNVQPVIETELQTKFSEFDDDFDYFHSQMSALVEKFGQSEKLSAPDPVPGSDPGETADSRFRVSQNLPLEHLFPPALQEAALTATEQNVYLQLSVEYHIIMDKAASFHSGVYNWNQLLPERLQSYGLTEDAWERISTIGDGDERIQEQLDKLIEKLFGKE